MGTNALVGFDFRITYSNGIEVNPESLLRELPQTGKFLDSEAPTVEPLVSQESVNVPVSLLELLFTSSPFAAETTSTLATSEQSTG